MPESPDIPDVGPALMHDPALHAPEHSLSDANREARRLRRVPAEHGERAMIAVSAGTSLVEASLQPPAFRPSEHE